MKSGNLVLTIVVLVLCASPAYAHMSNRLHMHAEQSVLLLSTVSLMLLIGFVMLYRGRK